MVIRSVDDDSDGDAVASLVSGQGGLSEAKFVDVMRGPARHGAGIVAEMGGEVVGYGHALPIAEEGVWAVEVVLADGHRVSEHFAELTAGAIATVPPGKEVRVWTNHPAHARAVSEAGFETIRELRRLGRPLPPDIEAGLPEGVEVRGFRVGRDEQEWIDVNNAAFADHPENRGWDLRRLEETMALPWFDAAGLLMAWEEGELVGSCWTKLHGAGVGEIYIIGVHPRRHGRGLGRALSLAGLWHLYSVNGAQKAILYADAHNAAGNAMYDHLGFVVEHTSTEFRAV